MKLDHDCVRDVLIWVEENVQIGHPVYTSDMIPKLEDKWSEPELIYCVIQLNEAGLIDGAASIQGEVVSLNQLNKLTWEGHKYLDNIRDDSVWKETKTTVASKVGSASLSIFSAVAAKVIENRLGF